MVLPNKNSKYFLIVNEDNFGVEKWKSFVNNLATGDKTSPPTNAQQYQDFLSVDFSGGGVDSDSGDSDTYEDANLSPSIVVEGVRSKTVNPELLIDFRDLLFLLYQNGRLWGLDTSGDLSDVITGTSVFLYGASDYDKTGSFSLYVGKYVNEEFRLKGCQISSLEYSISENQVIPFTVSMQSQDDSTDLLKNQGSVTASSSIKYPSIPELGKAAYSTPIMGNYLQGIYLYTGSAPLNLQDVLDFADTDNDDIDDLNPYIRQIGCSVTESSFNYDLDLSDASEFTACSRFSRDAPTTQLKGEATSGSPTLEIELTNKQTTALFLNLSYGAEGLAEYIKTNASAIVQLYANSLGEIVVFAMSANLVVTSPNFEKDPTENLTFTGGGRTSFIVPNGESSVTQPHTPYALWYQAGGANNMSGIGYATITFTSANIGENMMIRKTDSASTHYQDYNDAIFITEINNARSFNFPLWQRGVAATDKKYNLISLALDESETVKGSFIINASTDTETNPKDLTSLWNSDVQAEKSDEDEGT
ncbi:MAG: hypothetical protein LBC39_02665 [Methanobrevibacter sp.]|jgi:hypothetical protein|nr:hypothetical protein [Candidatus Methanovirga aequatorialis]